MNKPLKLVVPLAVVLAQAACAANGTSNVPGAEGSSTMLKATSRGGSSPIQHVIFIVQENRSFNNLFMGYPGAKTQNYGYDTTGDKIVLHSQDLAQNWDINHFSPAFFAACDAQKKLPGTHCKMDGWNNEGAAFGSPPNYAYAFVPHSQIKPYWTIAKQYVLADHMFASNLDGSFVAHQYAIAAYASRAVDSPQSYWGCEGGSQDTVQTLTAKRTYGPSIVACFDNPTIGSEADAAGVSWRFYAGTIDGDGGLWSSYQADRAVFNGPDWTTNVISPPSQFLTDIEAGQLANVTWITPTYANSDHPGLNSRTGPAWVASLVNAVGTSQFWSSTAIFVMWDDWGGWFDPVKPVFKDYDGLGFRVPILMVSPYAKRGYVTHVPYETASVLRFIEDTFGLAQLAAADARANDPAIDAFDYSQAPRKFEEIPGAKPRTYWMLQERRSPWHAKPKSFLGDD